METTSSQPDKTIAAFIHLSTFSKYLFPFGNFILPLIFWTAKQKDPFVDHHGKQALNFQISMFLYFILLVCIGVAGVIFWGVHFNLEDPFIISENYISTGHPNNLISLFVFAAILGFLFIGLFVLDIVAVILATIKASEGQLYKYPLTINFIRPTQVGKNQSKNEQFNNIQNQTL
ncbi:DUF4870 domain-containing protein [Gillisia hiemivivida]|jgi:uncharacterized Tic20 family protein|uniref:DUF4870 domain-containing protein n=1 Tax=Gillisia hiemivivida TaxID=291190 RepID=A0A5C6ZX42_9FLAO|nr:DUF4870 domain-containing protein [Gillisia hiemivivida]TXD95308.1 DUF4870 domain-containing protein [Gillisia hiemivivida]